MEAYNHPLRGSILVLELDRDEVLSLHGLVISPERHIEPGSFTDSILSALEAAHAGTLTRREPLNPHLAARVDRLLEDIREGGRTKLDEYERGYLDALATFAYTTSEPWAEPGVQYVGTTGTTRAQAAREFLIDRGIAERVAAEVAG